MIPDLRSSIGQSTTSEIGFYPGNLELTGVLDCRNAANDWVDGKI